MVALLDRFSGPAVAQRYRSRLRTAGMEELWATGESTRAVGFVKHYGAKALDVANNARGSHLQTPVSGRIPRRAACNGCRRYDLVQVASPKCGEAIRTAGAMWQA